MKKFTLSKAPFEGGRVRYILTRSVLSWLLIAIIGISNTFAQTLNYATADLTGNRERAGWLVVALPGASGVTKLSDNGEPGYTSLLGNRGFYYGQSLLNSNTTSSTDAATLTASRAVSVSLLGVDLLTLAGGDAYIQFRYSNTTNPVPAGTTSYVKIGARPTSSGLAVPVGGLLSLGDNAPITGSLYSGASAYVATGAVSNRNENPGTVLSGTFSTKLLVNKSGEWFAGVTPSNTTDSYNSVRLGLRIPSDLLGVNVVNRTDVNIYNAFYITPGSAGCNDKPRFAGEGDITGLVTLDANALKVLSLGSILSNPQGAIDDNVWGTASTIRTGVAGVTTLGTVSQSFYFDHTTTANDEVLLKLSVPSGILNATLLGGIIVKAYNGSNPNPVNEQTIASNLLGVNLANLLDISVGGNTFKQLEVGVKPGAAFDRIEVSLDGGVLSLGVLANGLNIHDVALAPSTPTLTGTPALSADRTRKVYVGQNIQTVTATSTTGNSVSWYEAGNATALATGTTSLNFPNTVSFSTAGERTFYATAIKPSCTNQSAQAPLYVTVLGVSYSNPPNGTQGVVYSNPVGFTGVSGSSYTFNAVTPTQLPPGLTLASDGTISGTPTSSGSFNFNVAIQDVTLGIPVGTHQYTLVITSNLAATPGSLPFGIVEVDYKNGTSAISIPSPTGGSTPYTYAPQNAGNLPPGLTLNSDGTITGTPTTNGTYTFVVNITDNTTNTVSGSYSIKVYPALVATPGDLPYGVVGVEYKNGAATVVIPSATGGSGAYTYTATDIDDLPPGLTFNSDRTITGTPTQKGSFTFAVEIKDDTTMQEVTQNYSIVIGQPDLAMTVTTISTVFNSTTTTRNAILNVTNVSTDQTLGPIQVLVTNASNFEIDFTGSLQTMSLPGPTTIHNPEFTRSQVGNFVVFTLNTPMSAGAVKKIGITIRKKTSSTATTSEYLNVRVGLNSGGEGTGATGNNFSGATLVIQK